MSQNQFNKNTIKKIIKTEVIGSEVYYFDSLPSTQDKARSLAVEGTPEGTIVIAGQQTAGRGRFGRNWHSPVGQNLYISIVLYPDRWMAQRLSVIASLAVIRTLRAMTDVEVVGKWPNDVLLNGRKVAGVLVESESTANSLNFAVIGIGINISFNLTAFPDIVSTATSVNHETGLNINRLQVLQEVLTNVEDLYSKLRIGTSPLQEWRASMSTIGKEVQVKSGDVIHHGVARDIDDEGNLLLQEPDGTHVTLIAGDVTTQI